jgi:hypothetical protein
MNKKRGVNLAVFISLVCLSPMILSQQQEMNKTHNLYRISAESGKIEE